MVLERIQNLVEKGTPGFLLSPFWVLFTFVICPIVSRNLPRVGDWYKKQSAEKRLDWDARVSASLHSAICFAVNAYAMCADKDYSFKDLYSHSELVSKSLDFSLGYFWSDLIVCYRLRNYYGSMSTVYYTHHFVSIFGLTQSKWDGGMWLCSFRLLSELSTPFMNINFMLELLNLKDSKIHKINQELIFWSFAVCRPLCIPLFYYCSWHHVSTGQIWKASAELLFVWVVCGLVLDVLNTVWFCLMSAEYIKKKMEVFSSPSKAQMKKAS